MELKLTFSCESDFDVVGVFVESRHAMDWIAAASLMEFEQVRFYPVPGTKANTVSGILMLSSKVNSEQLSRYTKIYCASASFYLPLGSQLSPRLSEKVILERFGSTPHFFHPVYGLIELKELTDWSTFLDINPIEIASSKPEPGPESPTKLGAYYIREVDPEESLKSLIAKSVPNRKSLDSKPLSSWEKVKLRAYRSLLRKKGNKDTSDSAEEANAAPAKDGAEAQDVVGKKSWWKRRKERMHQDFENLEDRSKKELDKLMDLLKKNPDEALMYALPIDRSAHSRGPEVAFTMQRRWGAGFGSGSGSSGSVNISDRRTDDLRQQYRSMAANYTQEEKWEKASFVYMELLSDPTSAANVLKQGKKYEAAAAIYLSKCKLKERAAECYEMGNFHSRAIDLYEELNRQEKVGDLYMKMGNESKARAAYSKEIDGMTKSNRFYDAGHLSADKLNDIELARTYYMQGWNEGHRTNDCLNEFLDTFESERKKEAMLGLHREGPEGRKAHNFLEVLKKQSDKDAELRPDIEQIMYETIARNVKSDRQIIDKLQIFNKSQLVSKDVLRFKNGRRLK